MCGLSNIACGDDFTSLQGKFKRLDKLWTLKESVFSKFLLEFLQTRLVTVVTPAFDS